MAEQVIESAEIIHDENGSIYLLYRVRVQGNLLLKTMAKGKQIARGAAQATYACWQYTRPYMPLLCYAYGAVALVRVGLNLRIYFRRWALPRHHREAIWQICGLVAGTMIFCKSISAFSYTLKKDDIKWLPCLVLAASGYLLAVKSFIRFGRILNNVNALRLRFICAPLIKCSQLLFGPTLIGCATYYLVCIRSHEESWVFFSMMFPSYVVGATIAYFGHVPIGLYDENEVVLVGLRLMIGGCLTYINGILMILYVGTLKCQHYTGMQAFCICESFLVLLCGVVDIVSAVEIFAGIGFGQIDPEEFMYISGMIGGALVFASSMICIKFVRNTVVECAFIILSGTGLATLASFITDLYGIVPRNLFFLYCQRMLGSFLTIYASISSVLLYNPLGWRFSLGTLFFAPVGIYMIYRSYN